ncbi:MAG: CotH kinase family protein [Flavobacteriales bacterium]|nr:CotH kinase family protein [Flavobacteriales bacterium]
MSKHLLICFFLFTFVQCASPAVEDENEALETFFCDVECVVNSTNSSPAHKDCAFSKVGVSTQYAFSGNHSILLHKGNPYGLSITIDSLVTGDRFEISVWQKNVTGSDKCWIVANEQGKKLYYKSGEIVEEKAGWQHIKMKVEIPRNTTNSKVKFHLWNSESDSIYIDDFKIERVKYFSYPVSEKLDQLNISIKAEDYAKLEKLRFKAINDRILYRSKGDYVPVSVNYNGQESKGKIRLKGDKLDHLKNDKWSFKIKLKDELNDGLKSFSIQTPLTRGYLDEYVFHQFLNKEGIYSPEYNFVQVTINNRSLGIYALEESSTTRMIEQQGGERGPILKFDDEVFWKNSKQPDSLKIKDVLAASFIKVLNKKSCDTNLQNTALKILKQYQEKDWSVYGNFDLVKMAKYYALCDVLTAYHSMGWINIRFYFNPKTNKMEPIGYDGYAEVDHLIWGNPFLGHSVINKDYTGHEPKTIIFSVFDNTEFRKLYDQYLIEFTRETYVKVFLSEIEIDFIEQELKIEFPEYKYNRNFIIDKAKLIRANIKAQ